MFTGPPPFPPLGIPDGRLPWPLWWGCPERSCQSFYDTGYGNDQVDTSHDDDDTFDDEDEDDDIQDFDKSQNNADEANEMG